ncbi:MAG: hypothetical protein ACYCO4_02405 [Sulfobacillus sp.]
MSRHGNPFERMMKWVLTLVGLGFLAGTFVSSHTADGDGQRTAREELAKRLRHLADKVEKMSDSADETSEGDA